MSFLEKPFAPHGSIFDTHAHYDDQSFDENRFDLLKEMFESGVGYIINNAVDLEKSADLCLLMSQKFDTCFTALGVHPENVETQGALADIDKLSLLSKNEKVVAIGEIGLDYHYSEQNKALQKTVFGEQIDLANALSLPVIVHDRDAHGDTFDIIKSKKPTGVIHCFSGSVELAKEFLKLDLFIGVGGVVTFSNAKKLVEVVKYAPLDRLLLETDAPYLSPVPYRGKQCNSALIYYTALKIAEIKNVSVETVLNTTMNNAKQLFNIK